MISGGTSVNSIPYESKMEIDTRSIDPSRLDTLKGLLETSVQEALDAQNERRRIGKELTVAIDMIGNRPSGELSSDLPLIQRALAATAALGKRPQLTRGSTNSNVPISLGIPAVTIGHVKLITLDKSELSDHLVDWSMIGASMSPDQHSEASFSADTCLVIGNEGKGISSEIASSLTRTIHIRGDQDRQADSLNAAISTGILAQHIWGQQL